MHPSDPRFLSEIALSKKHSDRFLALRDLLSEAIADFKIHFPSALIPLLESNGDFPLTLSDIPPHEHNLEQKRRSSRIILDIRLKQMSDFLHELNQFLVNSEMVIITVHPDLTTAFSARTDSLYPRFQRIAN